MKCKNCKRPMKEHPTATIANEATLKQLCPTYTTFEPQHPAEPPCPVSVDDRGNLLLNGFTVYRQSAIAICFQHGVEKGLVQPYRSEDDNIVYLVPSVDLTFKSPAEAVAALWPSVFREGGGE